MELYILSLAGRAAVRYTSGSYLVTYLLCIAAFIFAMVCSARVNSTFSRYSSVRSRSGITAEQAARQILDDNGLYNVQIVRIGGNLTDNYNPSTNTVSLSDKVYGSSSLAAIGVAAHECGHAVQHAQGYLPIKIRTAVVPLAQIGSFAYFYVFLLGLIFNLDFLVNAGILLFFFVVAFQLVTLPVEFNASYRALTTLGSKGILTGDEIPMARKTLSAAAMTYVASLLVSLTQLLRLIARAKRR